MSRGTVDASVRAGDEPQAGSTAAAGPSRTASAGAAIGEVARPGHARRRSVVRGLTKAGIVAVSFPLAVLLHEGGHFLAFSALGFEGVTLRHASVAWSGHGDYWYLIQAGDRLGAGAIAPAWQVAVAIGAGPLVTGLTVLICWRLVRSFGPSTTVLAVGLASPLRSLAVLPGLGRGLLGGEVVTGLDESRFAVLTGTPELPLLTTAVITLIAGWWLLVSSIPRGERFDRFVPAAVAILLGGPAWLLWLGPWLLP